MHRTVGWRSVLILKRVVASHARERKCMDVKWWGIVASELRIHTVHTCLVPTCSRADNMAPHNKDMFLMWRHRSPAVV